MKRIQLLTFDVKETIQTDPVLTISCLDDDQRSTGRKYNPIVTNLHETWLGNLFYKWRPICMLISIVAILFNLTHDLLMITSIVPVYKTQPLIVGDFATMSLTLFTDCSFFGSFYVAFYHKITITKIEQKAQVIGLDYDNPMLIQLLRKTRNQVIVYGFIFLACWLINVIIFSIFVYQNNTTGNRLIVIMEIIHIVNLFLLPVLPSYKFYLLFTSAMFIRSVYILFKHELVKHQPENWNFNRLRFYRKMYSRINNLTKTVNAIWSNVLAVIYLMVNIFAMLLLFYTLLGEYNPLRFGTVGMATGTVFLLVFVINHFIIGINVEASTIYDTIYTRLMASILTLMVTIMIAFPTFIS